MCVKSRVYACCAPAYRRILLNAPFKKKKKEKDQVSVGQWSNIEWPSGKQEIHCKSKLDECFLARKSHNLHIGVYLSFRISTLRCRDPELSLSPSLSNYSSIMGLNEHRYGEMPRIKETLANYLSPASASSLKVPTPLTKTSKKKSTS